MSSSAISDIHYAVEPDEIVVRVCAISFLMRTFSIEP